MWLVDFGSKEFCGFSSHFGIWTVTCNPKYESWHFGNLNQLRGLNRLKKQVGKTLPITLDFIPIGHFPTAQRMTDNAPPVLLMVPTDEEDIEMEKELSKTQSQGQNKFDSFFHSPKQVKSGSQISSSPVITSSSSMVSTGFENFQDVIKEQGVLVPLAISVFKHFQNELSKFLGEKLSRFNGSEDIKVTVRNFSWIGFWLIHQLSNTRMVSQRLAHHFRNFQAYWTCSHQNLTLLDTWWWPGFAFKEFGKERKKESSSYKETKDPSFLILLGCKGSCSTLSKVVILVMDWHHSDLWFQEYWSHGHCRICCFDFRCWYLVYYIETLWESWQVYFQSIVQQLVGTLHWVAESSIWHLAKTRNDPRSMELCCSKTFLHLSIHSCWRAEESY